MKKDRTDECDLVRACLAGDEDAWAQLVERYTAFVQAVVRRTLRRHGRDPETQDAEALVVEAFSALAENGGRLLALYDGSYSLATYLRIIARSRAVSQLRRKGVSTRSLDEEAFAGAAEYASPEELAIREERCRLLTQAVEKLPPRDRIIVRLYFLEELSYAEIAGILGISINSVGPVLSRAKSRLQDMLGRGGSHSSAPDGLACARS